MHLIVSTERAYHFQSLALLSLFFAVVHQSLSFEDIFPCNIWHQLKTTLTFPSFHRASNTVIYNPALKGNSDTWIEIHCEI